MKSIGHTREKRGHKQPQVGYILCTNQLQASACPEQWQWDSETCMSHGWHTSTIYEYNPSIKTRYWVLVTRLGSPFSKAWGATSIFKRVGRWPVVRPYKVLHCLRFFIALITRCALTFVVHITISVMPAFLGFSYRRSVARSRHPRVCAWKKQAFGQLILTPNVLAMLAQNTTSMR